LLPPTNICGRSLLLLAFKAKGFSDKLLAAQIPDQAFIFQGSYDDPTLTQAEIEKAADLLVRMQLGVEEEAPVIISFEYAPQQYQVVDFATEQRKRQAQD